MGEADLPLLNEDDLIQLGVIPLGPRRRILDAITTYTPGQTIKPTAEVNAASARASRRASKSSIKDSKRPNRLATPDMTNREALLTMFKKVETSLNGKIDAAEFVAACQELDPTITLQQSADAFTAFDTNSSGELEFEVTAYVLYRSSHM